MSNFPYGVNAQAGTGNPFAIPRQQPSQPPGISAQGSGNPHGSPERRGSTRARSREREERGAGGDKRPRTPRTPVASVPEEAHREHIDGRVTALENLAVTHATFLQQVHDDVSGVKSS